MTRPTVRPGRAQAGADLAIVISNHNYGRYLEQAVASASGDQQGVTTQVIVVDDGSTDESGEVLARLPEEVLVIRQANGGQAAAMNTGFREVDATAVVFLDADDWLLPGTGAAVVAALAAAPDAVRVQFPLVAVDGRGQRLGWQLPEPGVDLPVGDLRERVLNNPDDLPWQPTSGNAFKATALRRILPMPEAPYRVSADHYLSNLTPLTGSLLALPEPGAAYRVHGANNDHRSDFDVERVHAIIERTLVTHREVTRFAHELGLACDLDSAPSSSVTFIANRLVSVRVAPVEHPIPVDRRWRLVGAGCRAALGRRDASVLRRLSMGVWFVAAGAAPKAWVPRLARVALKR
jgi:Glycosyl transferase family 2